MLANESPFPVTIDSYGIESSFSGGVLDTSWDGLRDTESGWLNGLSDSAMSFQS